MEINRKFITEEPAETDSDQRVAGEVGKYLGRVANQHGKELDGRFRRPEDGAGHRRGGLIEIIGDHLFEEIALGERADRVPPADIAEPLATDLAINGLALDDGPATICGKKVM